MKSGSAQQPNRRACDRRFPPFPLLAYDQRLFLFSLSLPRMSGVGTLRGTPKGTKSYNSSSNIPRPSILDSQGPSTPTGGAHSEAGGGSTLSASRAKQSKRDEVCRRAFPPLLFVANATPSGHSSQSRKRPQQAQTWPSKITDKSQGAPGLRPLA